MGRKVLSWIKTFGRNIIDLDAYSVCEVVSLALSILMSILSYFTKENIFLVLILVFCVIGLIFLMIKTFQTRNYRSIIEKLIQKNRISSVRMLLTHDFYKNAPSSVTDGYSCSKLSASYATYNYKIINNGNGTYDLQCKFRFELLEKQKSNAFNIMILQPRGLAFGDLTYTYVCTRGLKQRHTVVHPIEFEEKSTVGFSGIIIGKICTPEDISGLIVDYTLKSSYEIKPNSAILIYPRFYVKDLKAINIAIDCTEIDAGKRPKAAYVENAPCDGSTDTISRIIDLEETEDGSIWSGRISGRKCKANSLYIVGIHS